MVTKLSKEDEVDRLTASMGRTAKYSESGTREASSMTISFTPEKQRTVASSPGRLMMRLPFARAICRALSCVTATGRPSP